MRDASVEAQLRSGPTVVHVQVFDYASPLAAGMVHQVSGHAPQTGGQVDISPALASAEGLSVGSSLAVLHPDRHWQVAGTPSTPPPSAPRRSGPCRAPPLWVPRHLD
ncbi:MAG: hypothetical protein ACRDWV_08160 [Acidimicrobiales bacterium]